jgi:hypothetical protein
MAVAVVSVRQRCIGASRSGSDIHRLGALSDPDNEPVDPGRARD